MKPFHPQRQHHTSLGARLCLLLFGWMMAAAGQTEAATIDFGEMQLATSYELKNDFNTYEGHFTAPRSGTLTVSATNGCLMTVYSDAEFTQPIDYTHQFTATGEAYDLHVSEGTTYHFQKVFCMADGTITLTMEEAPEVLITQVVPAAGSVFNLGDGGQISIVFNRAFRADAASICVGETTRSVPMNILGSTAAIDTKSALLTLMQEGTLTEGQTFTLRITGVRSAADESVIYGTDGTAEIQYVSGAQPITLTSTTGIEGDKFLSYWLPGDPRSLITLTFSGPLLSHEGRDAEAVATLGYGDIELEGRNYYTETLPYVVSGSTLTLDLSGRLRRHRDMVEREETFPEVYIKVTGVRAADGSFALNDAQGSRGAFSFTLPYEEISLDIISEFTPASGASLQGVSEIELWATAYDDVRHEGFLFTYTDAMGEAQEHFTSDFTATPDPDYAGASILRIAVPAEVAEGRDVTLSAHHLQTADGIDHSQAFTATYNPSSTGIPSAPAPTPRRLSVHDLSGRCVLQSATLAEIRRLPSGIYVVNGRKHIVN